ncbi:hypothetical protein SSX86_026376 [Deinandra increscens subsp. villosa]|uniref:SBP-type domain-containing protein n=1 Tax=Deinandra increscens subsp. villosa TaxID=3103831 RepID=A0AAP0CEC5_9ASTR
MDWNLNTPTEWDWENLAMYTTKEMEVIPKDLPFSSQENVVVDDVNFSFSASVDSSSKETIKTFGGFDDLPKDFLEKEESASWVGENGSYSNMVEEASVLSGEAMIGLKLGRNIHMSSNSSSNNKTVATTSSVSLFPTSSPMIKRSRASYLNSQSPRCQVEGCNLDLSSAKDYHRRHRICANHSKSPKVIVAGMERRFCQQCSRKVSFHDLSEFDDRKRSCRRRLSAHNARRRRPQSEEIHFSSTRMSTIHDRRPQMNFLLNRESIPILDSATPESSCSFKGEECLIGFAKGGGGVDVLPTNGALNFGSERFTPRNSIHNGIDPTSNSILSGDVRNAFSLLSTSSWSSSWPEEPSSFNQFAHGNGITSLSQPRMPPELQNATSNSQLQDFRSFRSPHEFDQRFYGSN